MRKNKQVRYDCGWMFAFLKNDVNAKLLKGQILTQASIWAPEISVFVALPIPAE